MKRCDHDHVYSGRTNAAGLFECICRRCGELGFREHYDLSQVNVNEFYAQRVAHGWPSRPTLARLPAPPRMPRIEPREMRWKGPLLFNGAVFLGAVAFGLWCGARDTEHCLIATAAGLAALFGTVVSFAGWRKVR